MAEIYFTLPGALSGCFKSACAIGASERLLLAAHAPGIAFLEKRPEKTDFTLEHAFAPLPALHDDGTNVTVLTPKTNRLPSDLKHVLYGIERRELVKRRLYPVHAACVGRGDAYTLIVGHSGAGKTTLAQRLVDNEDLKLFSGNKTVIRFEGSVMKAIAGTKTMTALDTKLARHAYEMPAGKYAPEAEVTVNAIALIRVNDGVEEEKRLAGSSALHTLFPFFMDAVNADTIVNACDVLDGGVTREEKSLLARNLALSLSAVPARRLSGSMAYLERKVAPPC